MGRVSSRAQTTPPLHPQPEVIGVKGSGPQLEPPFPKTGLTFSDFGDKQEQEAAPRGPGGSSGLCPIWVLTPALRDERGPSGPSQEEQLQPGTEPLPGQRVLGQLRASRPGPGPPGLASSLPLPTSGQAARPKDRECRRQPVREERAPRWRAQQGPWAPPLSAFSLRIPKAEP